MILNKAKKNNLRKLNSEYSEVIYTIYGKGMKQIVSNGFQAPPDKIIFFQKTIKFLIYLLIMKKFLLILNFMIFNMKKIQLKLVGIKN